MSSDSDVGRRLPDGVNVSGDIAECKILRLDQIDGVAISWLWPGKFARGQVTVVAGEASSGKSLLTAEIAARVSNGEAWPDAAQPSTRSPGSVVIAHSDRHLNGVLKRRLLVANGDSKRLAIMNDHADEREDSSTCRALLDRLVGALQQISDCSLVVIDHLQGWLRKASLRHDEFAMIFDELAEFAAKHQVALVVVWRLDKSGRGGVGRMLDALMAVAPVVWLLTRDPYNLDGRLAICAQNQLGPPAGNLAFRIEADRVIWQTAARQVAADDVVAASTRSVDRHERRQAGTWLLEVLSGGPIEANQLWEEARKCHLAERTVRRAAAELGLHPIKDGRGGPWRWGWDTSSSDQVSAAKDSPRQNVAAFQSVGSLPNCPTLERQPQQGTAPNVAAFERVGSLPNSPAKERKSHATAARSVAAFEKAGSLPNRSSGDEVRFPLGNSPIGPAGSDAGGTQHIQIAPTRPK